MSMKRWSCIGVGVVVLAGMIAGWGAARRTSPANHRHPVVPPAYKGRVGQAHSRVSPENAFF